MSKNRTRRKAATTPGSARRDRKLVADSTLSGPRLYPSQCSSTRASADEFRHPYPPEHHSPVIWFID